MLDLEPAAREVVRLLDGITDDQLADPTPCADTPVAGLLDHFMDLSQAFTSAARKTPPSGRGGGVGPRANSQLDPQWRTELPQRLTGMAQAWRDPDAWQGMAQASGVQLPAEVMAVVALDELVLHGWDLARATGQSFDCDPVSTTAVLGFTRASAQPEQAHMREGLFGPVVDVPEDASGFDRALGFARRNPNRTPDR